MIDVHCYWTVSYSSFDVWDGLEELLKASTGHSWVILYRLCSDQLSNYWTKYQIWGTLSQQIMGWSTAEIDIHCSWSISYPAFSYILKVGWASGIIFEPLIVHMVPFLSKSTLKLHANCQIWCALSAQEMGCYITMRGIHCWWSGPYPSWNVWDR